MSFNQYLVELVGTNESGVLIAVRSDSPNISLYSSTTRTPFATHDATTLAHTDASISAEIREHPLISIRWHKFRVANLNAQAEVFRGDQQVFSAIREALRDNQLRRTADALSDELFAQCESVGPAMPSGTMSFGWSTYGISEEDDAEGGDIDILWCESHPYHEDAYDDLFQQDDST